MLSNKAISLDLYPSLPALDKGIEKNLYRQFNYQKLPFSLSLLTLLLYIYCPLIFIGSGNTMIIKMAIAILTIRYCLFLMQPNNSWFIRTFAFIVHPLSGLMLAYIAIRAVFLAEKRQTILWGEVAFPLAKLKAFLKQSKT